MHKRIWPVVGMVLAMAGAFAHSPAFAETAITKAAANFAGLSVEARYEIQTLLIAAGYSNAVSNETFNSRTFDAITRFQTENGFAANGTLTPEQFVRLHQIADPILQLWGLTLVHHPATGFPLWVPAGLGLQKKVTSDGVQFSLPRVGLVISLSHYPRLGIQATHNATLEVLKEKNLTINYDVLRSNFFVISTADPTVQSYMRYEAGRAGITGFWIMYDPAAPIYGSRLTALMSDLFRSAASGVVREPPQPVLQVAATKPSTQEEPPPAAQSKPPKEESGPASGSGFFVSSAGDVLTNAHVIDGCKTISVSQQGAPPTPARLVAKDATNDLALLHTGLTPKSLPSFRVGVRVGESISAYGFPLNGFLATNGNFTTGNITATAGLQDDSRMFQVSSPVQPGNSGGPLLDQNGNVIGIIVSKLNALKIAEITQDVPQNINFAIKASVAQTFLETNSVSLSASPSTTHLPPEDVADKAKSFSVFIECRGN